MCRNSYKKGSIKADLSFVYKCAKEILKYSKKKRLLLPSLQSRLELAMKLKIFKKK